MAQNDTGTIDWQRWIEKRRKSSIPKIDFRPIDSVDIKEMLKFLIDLDKEK